MTSISMTLSDLVAVRYASHTDCLEFPVPFGRGYAAPRSI